MYKDLIQEEFWYLKYFHYSKEGVLLSHECAIKIYKTTLNEFKNRGAYVDGDHRFSRDEFKKNNPRKVIRIWGEKETANLNRSAGFFLS